MYSAQKEREINVIRFQFQKAGPMEPEATELRNEMISIRSRKRVKENGLKLLNIFVYPKRAFALLAPVTHDSQCWH